MKKRKTVRQLVETKLTPEWKKLDHPREAEVGDMVSIEYKGIDGLHVGRVHKNTGNEMVVGHPHAEEGTYYHNRILSIHRNSKSPPPKVTRASWGGPTGHTVPLPRGSKTEAASDQRKRHEGYTCDDCGTKVERGVDFCRRCEKARLDARDTKNPEYQVPSRTAPKTESDEHPYHTKSDLNVRGILHLHVGDDKTPIGHIEANGDRTWTARRQTPNGFIVKHHDGSWKDANHDPGKQVVYHTAKEAGDAVHDHYLDSLPKSPSPLYKESPADRKKRHDTTVGWASKLANIGAERKKPMKESIRESLLKTRKKSKTESTKEYEPGYVHTGSHFGSAKQYHPAIKIGDTVHHKSWSTDDIFTSTIDKVDWKPASDVIGGGDSDSHREIHRRVQDGTTIRPTRVSRSLFQSAKNYGKKRRRTPWD